MMHLVFSKRLSIFFRLYASIGSHELKAFSTSRFSALAYSSAIHRCICGVAGRRSKFCSRSSYLWGRCTSGSNRQFLLLCHWEFFWKQDVGTSVVFVGVSVFVKTGGHFAYGAEYFLGVVNCCCEQVVVNVGGRWRGG